MWGQIDGVNKIVIARDVIADMLGDMEDDVSLGLTVYGHRERGACGDIETIVPPGPGTQDQILEAVNGINPQGRTPMADSIVTAARSLRHTENEATVILVSDGIENCNPDPCAIAAELEQAGVGFTAHVIGFDVASEPEARAQMQCIAENTGGLFLTADNADELGTALEKVVEAAQPTSMQVKARVMPENTLPTRPITWTILEGNGTIVADGAEGAATEIALMPGDYVARATRTEPEGPERYQTAFTVVQDMPETIVVPMPAIVETAPVTFTARVEPDGTVPASELIWALYDSENSVLLGPVTAPGGQVDLLPGDYRLEVVRVSQDTTHEVGFTVEPLTPEDVVVLLPPVLVDVTFTARIGSDDGPDVSDPVVWEVEPLEAEAVTANPATLQMPRGAYKVTGYWTAEEIEESTDFVIVDQPREIVVVFPEPQAQATLTAPASAVAGSTIEVGWTGPNRSRDFIGIGQEGAAGGDRWANYTRTEDGNPVSLVIPTEPGDYVLQYFLNEDRTSIASLPLEVTEVTASLTAPESAVAGSTIEVGWTGPDYARDFIGIGPKDAKGNDGWQNYSRTSDGNPLSLLLPTESGDYVIQYFLNQDRSSIASVPISLTDVSASLTTPASAVAGSTIEVGWTGPDNARDFIGVGLKDATGGNRWKNYTRTSDGNPLELLMPAEPGEYVIRYFLNQDRSVLSEATITLTDVSASITAPATSTAGGSVEVAWTGPDYPRDYIGIGKVGADGNARWESYARTNDGNPLQLNLPDAPGDYVIRYFINQNRAVLAEVPITLN